MLIFNLGKTLKSATLNNSSVSCMISSLLAAFSKINANNTNIKMRPKNRIFVRIFTCRACHNQHCRTNSYETKYFPHREHQKRKLCSNSTKRCFDELSAFISSSHVRKLIKFFHFSYIFSLRMFHFLALYTLMFNNYLIIPHISQAHVSRCKCDEFR